MPTPAIPWLDHASLYRFTADGRDLLVAGKLWALVETVTGFPDRFGPYMIELDAGQAYSGNEIRYLSLIAGRPVGPEDADRPRKARKHLPERDRGDGGEEGPA